MFSMKLLIYWMIPRALDRLSDHEARIARELAVALQ